MPQPWNSSLLLGSLLLLSLSCGDAAEPTPQSPQSPPPTPTSTSGFIWGQVLDQSGLCLHGAVVEIVQGPGTGRKSGQPDECDAWAYVGYEFRDLPLGATVTLRATAPEYQPEDSELRVPNGGPPIQFVLGD